MNEGTTERDPGRVTAFAPGSVGNLACGFDALGMALEGPGDRVQASLSTGSGVRIVEVTGSPVPLPLGPDRNSAAAAAQALLREAGVAGGVELRLHKGLPLSGGMGGSAASAAAAVIAVDTLFDLRSPEEMLLRAALEGEWVTSGSRHGDNAAASLFGGIVLVRDSGTRTFLRLPVPDGLAVALLKPHSEIRTEESRAVVPEAVPLRDAVIQWQNTAALVAALYEGDWELLSETLEDRVAEPARAPLIPGFHAVKQAALGAGALGSSISGAGPTIFALCRDLAGARSAGDAMQRALESATGAAGSVHLSPAGRAGARVEGGPGGAAVAPDPGEVR